MRDIELLESNFSEGQQAVLESFKRKLKDACDDAISSFYTDVTNFATTDAHTNYHEHMRNEFKESLRREVTEEYGHYSWAHSMRMEILEKHKDQLQNKIISDLQDRIKSLNKHIEDLRRYR